MFKEIFLFEFKTWFKKPALFIFAGILALLTFFYGASVGGLFSNVTSTFGQALINSAHAIAQFISGMNADLITNVILVAVIGPAVFKDFKHNVHPVLYTMPVSKTSYILGRFFASYSIAIIISAAIPLTLALTFMLPGIEQERLMEFNILNYLQPFFFSTMLNTLFIGAVFFSLVTFTRSMMAGYVGCIAVLVFNGIGASLSRDLDSQSIAAMLDPFGAQALNLATKYWTVDEQNTLPIPMSGIYLQNRLLWLAIGIAVLVSTMVAFSFAQFQKTLTFFQFGKRKNPALVPGEISNLSNIPTVDQVFDSRNAWKQLWFIAKFEFRTITKSVFFLIMMSLAVLLFVMVMQTMGMLFGTTTYPVTYQVAGITSSMLITFSLIVIVFYSGMSIWRERDARVDELTGSSPISNGTVFWGKMLAFALVSCLLVVIMILCGIGYQAYQGYYKFELDVYLKYFFGFQYVTLLMLCAVAMLVQTVFNNKFVGFFVTVFIVLIIPLIFGFLEWGHVLLNFQSGRPLPYSDMNGFGHRVASFYFFQSYWILLLLTFIIPGVHYMVRSKERGFKSRFKIMLTGMGRRSKLAFAGTIALFLLTGGFIYYNTNVLNEYRTPHENELSAVEFEKKYKKYEGIPQPRITDVYLELDIYPYERNAALRGHYILTNKTAGPIDSIHISILSSIDINAFSFDRKYTEVYAEKDDGYYIYKLEQALQPGDKLKFSMDLASNSRGFTSGGGSTSIVYNGTFINSSFMPSLGYNEQGEIDDVGTREKHGLPPKERMADVNDMQARMNTYISSDADWITFECILSTVKGQTAVAPGYLQKAWEEGDRSFFHYKMDSPILNFYSFLSAEYEVLKDKWNDVNIEIYYHKGHEYNLQKMVNGIKKSLDYYTVNFSPYQHKQVRILEFPRYASFAQSFPNTIPYSESIGFIADVDEDNPDDIDYPFYVTAHEVAHQWWAHQVIGGKVQGATVMSETMSQYSALMVMEKEFGKEKMRKFLRYEMDQYLSSRSSERRKELPLMLTENQQYIHYNKGSIIMYALQDYIGEDKLNAALRRYISKVAFQEAPYTNSVEFVDFIREATPDSLVCIIEDMFENITLFENQVSEYSKKALDNGKFEVTFTVKSEKFRSDSAGRSKPFMIDDWIDVAVFADIKDNEGEKTDKVLYLQKHRITKKDNTFTFIVDEEPATVGIDPYNKLIDRKPRNNVKRFDGDNEEDNDLRGIVISG